MTTVIGPGAAHPNAPMDRADLADRYGVDAATLSAWIDAGLPLDARGRGDPFAVVNWISWHRLAECPVLRRAWRGYLLVFAGFLAGERRPRRVRWQRRQRICLEEAAQGTWTWLVPRPWQGVTQNILADDGLTGRALPAGACWRVAGGDDQALQIAGRVELEVQPVIGELDPAITALVTDFAADFRYEYRHHAVAETLHGPERRHGSCLDAARTVAARLRQRGHDAQVVAGIIAHDTFANPHFWVELRIGPQCWPIDPSLPAIARMLGADWRAVARAYSGGCDARRVRLQSTALPTALGGVIGQIQIEGADAWPCLDWVCGECEDRFDDVSG